MAAGIAPSAHTSPDVGELRGLALSTPGVGPEPARWFITRYCLTLDEHGQVRPIPSWRYVLEFIDALVDGGDLHVEKSRQMMATWISCAYFLWALMFREGFAGFMASRKQALVDDGGENSTPNSLMGRVRFMYDRLPESFKWKSPVRFSHLRMDCLDRHSFVIGEAANGEIGRGGTYTQALVDEAAMLERSEASHRSIRLACQRGLIYQSTPNGRGNVFAAVKHEMPGSFRFLTLHWSRHPDRDQAWYDHLAANMTNDARARELDISYEHSVSGLVWPQFSEVRHVRDDVMYDPNLRPWWGLDFGIGAPTAGWFAQQHGRELWVLNDYELPGEVVSVHAANLEAKAREAGWGGRREDIYCAGDPAGNAREMVNASTVVRAYRDAGFVHFTTPHQSKKDGLGLVARLLHQNRIYFHPRCRVTKMRIPDYRFPTNDAGYVMGDEPVKNQPAGHVCDGGRYLVTTLFPIHDGFDGVTSRLELPPPLSAPVALQDTIRRPLHHPFRPISSGRYRPDGSRREF